jgi:hypothetical protein
MIQPNAGDELLPLPLPEGRVDRIVLICIRRMAAHGIRDAQATLIAIDAFGVNFRRPLVLIRAYIVELAQISQRSIKIAPCCAMRMTRDEGLIIGALTLAGSDLAAADQKLTSLLGNCCVGEPLSAAVMLRRTLEENARKRSY